MNDIGITKLALESERQRLCFIKTNCPLEELAVAEIEVIISALELQLANGWIPVSERLPDKDIYCYVTIKYKDNEPIIKNGYYQTEYGFSWPNVTAYIPKTTWPKEPYKETLE